MLRTARFAYGYNTLGQLQTVTANVSGGSTLGRALVTTYGYDPDGNMTSEILPNGVTDTYTYNSMNQVATETDKVGSTVIYSETNTYADNGLVASKVEGQLQTDGSTVITTTDTFSYDAMNRLTGETLSSSASNSNYTDSYTYDLDSNRLSETQVTYTGTETTASAYNGNDELTEQTDSVSGTTSFTYDANGSETKTVNGSTTDTYTFDVRNRMVSFSNGSTSATYVYDDAGDRVSETAGGATTSWLTNTNNPTGYDQPMEEKIGGSLAETYIIGDRVLGQADGSGTLTWLLVDGHGSTRLLTNASGTVTATLNYDAFGSAINFNPSTIGTIWQFGGDGYYDYVSGLTFHSNGRPSSISLGRFITMDPPGYGENTNPITLNPEIYGDGDPINNNDPSGHYSQGYTIHYGGAWAAAGEVVTGVEAESVAEGQLAIAVGDNAPNAMIEATTTEASTIIPTLNEDTFEHFPISVAPLIFAEQLAELTIIPLFINIIAQVGTILPETLFLGLNGLGAILHKISGQSNDLETLPNLSWELQKAFNQFYKTIGNELYDEWKHFPDNITDTEPPL